MPLHSPFYAEIQEEENRLFQTIIPLEYVIVLILLLSKCLTDIIILVYEDYLCYLFNHAVVFLSF